MFARRVSTADRLPTKWASKEARRNDCLPVFAEREAPEVEAA